MSVWKDIRKKSLGQEVRTEDLADWTNVIYATKVQIQKLRKEIEKQTMVTKQSIKELNKLRKSIPNRWGKWYTSDDFGSENWKSKFKDNFYQ